MPRKVVERRKKELVHDNDVGLFKIELHENQPAKYNKGASEIFSISSMVKFVKVSMYLKYNIKLHANGCNNYQQCWDL